VSPTVPISSTAPSPYSLGYEVILPRGAIIRLPLDFEAERVRELLSVAAWAC
jgi:hypothetical protein